MYPSVRPRRLRTSPVLRRMVRENHLRTDDLVSPIFVVPGSGFAREVSSMPGVFQLSIEKPSKKRARCWIWAFRR